MFLFDHAGRGAPPEGLRSEAVYEAIRLIVGHLALPDMERDQTDVPLVWKQTLPSDVLQELIRLSKGRCAFCEAKRSDLSTYRFRPPAYAERIKKAEGKESYLWLAFSWQNLFPICRSCRPERPNVFPVVGSRSPLSSELRRLFEGGIRSTQAFSATEDFINLPLPDRSAEKAKLYHPGEPTPAHARFSISFSGQLIGLNTRARSTISTFNLNAAETIEERRRAIVAVLRDFTERAATRNPFRLDQSFAGSIYLVLRLIGEHLSARSREKPSLAPADILGLSQLFA